MVGSSKILTVSYGTFSCTLEGFDESFDTMKAIAEYFRDLAADDRYFGAEPPQPDADMLTRIAEREIARRVEAREENGAFHLRAAALTRPEAEGPAPAPSTEAASALAEQPAEPRQAEEPQRQAAPAPQAMAPVVSSPMPYAPRSTAPSVDNVAAKLRRIRAVVGKSDPTPDPLYVEDEEYDPYGFEVTDILGTDRPAPEDSAAAQTAPAFAEKAQPSVGTEPASPGPDAEAAAEPEAPAPEVTAEPQAPSLDEEAMVEADLLQEDAPQDAQSPDAEAEAEEPGEPQDDPERLVADPGLEDAPLDQDTALQPDPGAPATDESEDTAEALQETEDRPRRRARLVKMRRKEAEAAAADLAAEDEDEEAIALPPAPEPSQGTAPEETAVRDAPADETETLPAGGLQSSLTPEQEAELARELAEVEAELRAEAQAAMAEAGASLRTEPEPDDAESAEAEGEPAASEEEEAAETEDHPAESEAGEDASDAYDSAIRERIASRLKAAREDETPSAEQLRSVERGERSEETSQDHDLPAEFEWADFKAEAEVAHHAPDTEETLGETEVAETPEAPEGNNADLSPDEAAEEDQAPLAEAAEAPAKTTEPEGTQDESDAPASAETRDTAETDPGLAAQIRQLARRTVRLGGEGRALLTARSVEDESSVSRLMDETRGKMDEPEVGRRRSAIQHLRAAVAATKAEKELTGGQPSSDGSEVYRDDLASVVRPRRPGGGDAHTERPEGATRAAPLKLVAEQRIDEPAKGKDRPVQPRRVARPSLEEVGAAEGGGFPAYAEELGAHRLPDLLEAAASYLTFIEGREVFSRPQLMTKVRLVQRDAWSREDGLRTFGQMLREGKIIKIRGGRFSASEDIGFRPDDKRAVG